MLLIVGKVLGVTEHQRSYNGESWTERRLHVLDDMRTAEVTLSKDFDVTTLPARDGDVAVEVSVRAYAGKNGVGYGLTGWKVADAAPLSKPTLAPARAAAV